MKNYVNLDKALAEIRQYPGARTDRKVFTVIADYANDKGVAIPRQTTIAAETKLEQTDVSKSVHRLADRGFIEIRTTFDDSFYLHNTYTIDSRFLKQKPDTPETKNSTTEKPTDDDAPIVPRLYSGIVRSLSEIATAAEALAEAAAAWETETQINERTEK